MISARSAPARLRSERQRREDSVGHAGEPHPALRRRGAATLAVALAGAQSARAISAPVLIDAVTVENGVAVVTGTVDAERVRVNGQVIAVGDGGAFRAEVDASADVLLLELLDPTNEAISLRIPIDLLVSTGGNGILDALLGAGISIEVPSEGYKVVDGEMPVVEGRVLDDSELASLEVNGVDVLGGLGKNGLFSVDPGSASSSTSRGTVTVVATDRRGVSQTSTFTTTRVTSTIATRAGTSGSAAGARGIVIARVAFDKRFLKSAKHVANGALRATFTNRVGKAQFGFRLRASAFMGTPWKQLTFAARAATPKASATKRVTLRLPAAIAR